jgi:Zn-dependent peptidase ImmA (M78 family)
MNSLVKALIQPILEAMQNGIALVPGGFKPPTIGHFTLVDEVAKNPEVSKVIVLIGHKTRDGVTKEESKAIWDIYKKYLPSNIEIQIADNASPISDVSLLIKNNPDTMYYPVVGIRGEMDLGDLKRFDSMEGKYENFKPIVIRSEEGEDRISGTNTRAALIGGEKERFQTYLPTELSNEEKEEVWSILQKTPIEEMYAEPSEFSYPPMIKSLTEYMLDKGMNILPLPKVKFVDDDAENAKNFFGKTAYYDPNNRVIVLYTMNRHPKDVMRSYSHEMVHHMQNCEDRLGNVSTTDINEDDYLYKLEEEANKVGTMMFREWTDTYTKNTVNETVTDTDVICDKCGHSWPIETGGNDLYICHDCGNDNTPTLNEETESDILSFPSTFKSGVNITVIFKENKNYETLKPYFEEYGYGFYYPKDKTIFLDGEVFINSDLTFNDLKFVEAHEITHLLLGHTGPYSKNDEMDADLGAYILLKKNNLPTKKLESEFKSRHGVDFDEKLLDRVKDML